MGSGVLSRLRHNAWVLSTNFAEGLPYSVVRILSGMYFTAVGVPERWLGAMNWLGIPWNVRFLWAPLLDRFGRLRGWLVALQLALSCICALVAALAFAAGSSGRPAAFQIATAVVLIVMGLVSATNDAATDGYYMEVFPTQEQQAAYSGQRVLGFRVAMAYAGGGLGALAAWTSATSRSPFIGWGWAFAAAAVTVLVLALAHAVLLPRPPAARSSIEHPSYLDAFLSYVDRPRPLLVVLFILLYKLGDDVLFSMATPFFMRELKVSTGHFAWIRTAGGFATALGAALGGAWIQRRGLRRAIWPLTLLMNLNIWAYVWLAHARPDAATTEGLVRMALVHWYEQAAAGLGSAVLFVFLLSTCKPEHKAAHYAIGAALMSVGSSFIGGLCGWFVERAGYLALFVTAFAASLPSMLLLPFVPLPASDGSERPVVE